MNRKTGYAKQNQELATLRSVSALARPLRSMLADPDWESERNEIDASVGELSSALHELPLAPSRGKLGLEQKLARAAAEELLPRCHDLGVLLDLMGSGHWNPNELQRIRSLSEHLSASLGVFIVLAHGL